MMMKLNEVVLIGNLTQFRITWEQSLNEEFSKLGWPVGMSVRDCLTYMNYLERVSLKVGFVLWTYQNREPDDYKHGCFLSFYTWLWM